MIRLPQPRKPSVPKMDLEGLEQQAYFTWLQVRHREAYEHAFHVPNGGQRSKATAGRLKAQGVKAGVQDIFVDLARGAYHGLRIELKATPPHDAAVAPSQRAWNVRHNAAGYCALICKGFDSAKAATEAYLALGVFDGQSRIAP